MLGGWEERAGQSPQESSALGRGNGCARVVGRKESRGDRRAGAVAAKEISQQLQDKTV